MAFIAARLEAVPSPVCPSSNYTGGDEALLRLLLQPGRLNAEEVARSEKLAAALPHPANNQYHSGTHIRHATIVPPYGRDRSVVGAGN
jgi:hypothetical protein